jgi:hypothetical protein
MRISHPLESLADRHRERRQVQPDPGFPGAALLTMVERTNALKFNRPGNHRVGKEWIIQGIEEGRVTAGRSKSQGDPSRSRLY